MSENKKSSLITKSRLIELLDTGLNRKEIAEKLGVDRTTIQRYIRDYGLIGYKSDNYSERIKVDINRLKELLSQGYSIENIGKIMGYSPNTIQNNISKNNLGGKYKKDVDLNKGIDKTFLNKIDTPEKAYIIGFLLGDGHITEDLRRVYLGLQIKDKEILESIRDYIPFECDIKDDLTLNKKQRRFPNSELSILSPSFTKDLHQKFGGRLKPERHTPIVSKYLEPYLISGFFDADGGISFGRRKDRDRFWSYARFTGSYKTLVGIQKILDKNEISSSLRPKSKEKCYVLEVSSFDNVMKFYKYLPQDSIRLQRKVDKFNEWFSIINNNLCDKNRMKTVETSES